MISLTVHHDANILIRWKWGNVKKIIFQNGVKTKIKYFIAKTVTTASCHEEIKITPKRLNVKTNLINTYILTWISFRTTVLY